MVDLSRFAFPEGRFPQGRQGGGKDRTLSDILGEFGAASKRADQQHLERQEIQRAMEQRDELENLVGLFSGASVGGRIGPVEGGREISEPLPDDLKQSALMQITAMNPDMGKALTEVLKTNEELRTNRRKSDIEVSNHELEQSKMIAEFGAKGGMGILNTPSVEGKRSLAKELYTQFEQLGLDGSQFLEMSNLDNKDAIDTKALALSKMGQNVADLAKQEKEKNDAVLKAQEKLEENFNRGATVANIIAQMPPKAIENDPRLRGLKFSFEQIGPNPTREDLARVGALVGDERFKEIQKMGPQEQFAPVLDDQGNVIAQQNIKTKEVVADPRAPQGLTALQKDFQFARSQGFGGSFMDFIEAKRAKTSITTNVVSDKGIDQLGKKQADFLVESFDTARNARNTLTNINEAKDLMDAGVITGTGANFLTGFGNLLSSRLGISLAEDPVANTQAFASTMGRQVGEIIKQFGAGTGLSDADREFAQKIVGQDITLSEQAIRKLMDINERAFKNIIKSHNDIAKQAKKRLGDGVFIFDPVVDLPSDSGGLTPEEQEELRQLEEELGVE